MTTPSTLARETAEKIEKSGAFVAVARSNTHYAEVELRTNTAVVAAIVDSTIRVAVAKAEAERDKARTHTSSLLARIHGDGGHYEGQHGTSKAVEDAAAIVAKLIGAEAERDEARAELLAALKEAREDIDHWGSYASEYFQEKWHFADTIRGYDERIATLSPPAPDGTAPTRPGDDAYGRQGWKST